MGGGRDLALLEKIQRYFGVGKIYVLKGGTIQFQVSSIQELKVIIDHFDKYPLVTSKWADYILFKQGVELILNKAKIPAFLFYIDIKKLKSKGKTTFL